MTTPTLPDIRDWTPAEIEYHRGIKDCIDGLLGDDGLAKLSAQLDEAIADKHGLLQRMLVPINPDYPGATVVGLTPVPLILQNFTAEFDDSVVWLSANIALENSSVVTPADIYTTLLVDEEQVGQLLSHKSSGLRSSTQYFSYAPGDTRTHSYSLTVHTTSGSINAYEDGTNTLFEELRS